MKVIINEERMRELVRHILKKNFANHNTSEVKDLEDKVMKAFDENKLLEFIYRCITMILKNIKK